MKGIQLPKSIPSMKALLQKDLESREDSISVISIWDEENRKSRFERNKTRAGRPIPNIQDFEINLQPYDGLTSLFGMRKRKPSKKTFYTWYNDDANLFIDYKMDSIRKAVKAGKFRAAVGTIWVLMNSAAYQVAATNHVLRNGHRKLTLKEIILISKQVDKLVKRRATNINYSRAYIPKGDTVRPLGVPTIPGRIYLHMYNNCMVEGRSVSEKNKQHGYLPGKGILTAWTDLTQMLVKPNIYEADFKGFFNNVTHIGIKSALLNELHLPFDETNFIIRLNKSLVKLQDKDKIEEPDRVYPFDKDGQENRQADPSKDPRLISANAFAYYMANQSRMTLQEAVEAVQAQKAKGHSPIVKESRKPLTEEEIMKEAGERGKKSIVMNPGLTIEEIVSQIKAEEANRLSQGVTAEVHLLEAVKIIREEKIVPTNLYYQDTSPAAKLTKEEGVPQGAPTSCSFATLVLRYFEKLDVIFYADDVIYFPKSSDCDPVRDLTKKKYGLIINEEKSRGIKKDGVWLVDSFKFLGIRYFPPRTYPFDFGEIKDLILLATLIDICLGFPFYVVAVIITEIIRVNATNRERFKADTRNGADLEFTHRESFLSGLAVARQLMIDSEYFKKGTKDLSLVEGLEINQKSGMRLKSPLKLLFMKPFKNITIETKIDDLKAAIKMESPPAREERVRYIEAMLKDYQNSPVRYPDIERDLKRGIRELKQPVSPQEIEKLQNRIKQLTQKLGVRNTLTGFFVSRMQSNSGEMEVKQDFRLKYIAGSGCDQEWNRYSREGILPRTRMNVFTASTFANHDLLEWLTDYKSRERKPTFRRVYTKTKGTWFRSYIMKVMQTEILTSENMVF